MWQFMEKNRFWIRCFLSIWGVLLTVFSFYGVTFFFGNHDFAPIRYGVELWDGAWEARLTQFLLPVILTEGQVLPIIHLVLGLGFLSATVVLLARWYGFREKSVPVVLFGMLILLHPYILTQLYYVHTVLSIFGWHLLGVAGVILIYRTAEGRRTAFSYIAGAFCLLVCLCGYAASLQLMLAAVIGKFLTDVLRGDSFKLLMRRYVTVGMWLSLAVILYVWLTAQLKAVGIISDGMYNTQVLTPIEIWEKILHEGVRPFKILSSPAVYCPQWCGWLAIGVLLLAGCRFLAKKRLVLGGIGLIGLGYAMLLTAYFSPHGMFEIYRIHSFSVPYALGILFAVSVNAENKLCRNVAYTIAVVLILCFIKADFTAQKVWHLGNLQDIKAVERIKQEVLPKLDVDKHYRLTKIGGLNGRAKFAQAGRLPEKEMKIYREYFGFSYFINVYFSDGFFFEEEDNPIWGNGIYFINGILYGVGNKNIGAGQKYMAEAFNKVPARDSLRMKEAVQLLRPYPFSDYFYVGQKDIMLYLGEDLRQKAAVFKRFQLAK